MKAISLVFGYDFDKQVTSGRTWGKTGYKSKEFIINGVIVEYNIVVNLSF